MYIMTTYLNENDLVQQKKKSSKKIIISFSYSDGCGGTDWSADDHQCYRCVTDAVYWQTARSSCQRLGADLVTINNAGTQTFIESTKYFFFNSISFDKAVQM